MLIPGSKFVRESPTDENKKNA